MTSFIPEAGLAKLHQRLEPGEIARLSQAIEVATDFAIAALTAGFTSDEVAQLLRDCLVPAAVIAGVSLAQPSDPS